MTLDELARGAEAGDAEAQYCLGVAYMSGFGVERNWEAAQRWIIRAAASGYPGAHELGLKLTRWVELDEQLKGRRKNVAARFRDEAMVAGRSRVQQLRPWDAVRQALAWLSRRAGGRGEGGRFRRRKNSYREGNPLPESISLRDSA